MQAMSTTSRQAGKPWYREPWPWILMAGPGIVIIAAIYTAWLAISSADGLVTDDYYKKGLKAGETIAQSRLAEEMGIRAYLSLSRETIRIRLEAKPDTVLPTQLRVTLSHPTRAGLDQSMTLTRQGTEYVSNLLLPASGHWLVLLEDDAKTWRVMGSMTLPVAQETVIGGEPAARKEKP
jgi:uncharacterized protein